MQTTRRSSFALFTVVMTLLLAAPRLQAGTALLIWPIDPTIEAGERSVALWLENVGHDPVTVQIRLFAWEQRDYQDDYSAQQQLVSTPPFSSIEPGKKQLIRLTMLQPVPAGQERAFRILIDEIPTARNTAAPTQTNAGLRFQMRYSLPVFVYGKGLWRKNAPSGARMAVEQAQPQLSWSLEEIAGQRYLQVHNAGSGYARLSQVRMHATTDNDTDAAATQIDLAAGLLGYVLPGKTMRWPVNSPLATRNYSLQAQLAGGASPVTIEHR